MGLLQYLHPVGYGFGHGFEMAAIAKNLAAHGTFANPFEPAITGPTAVVPPLHPFFLGLIFRLFPGSLSVILPTLGNIVANALTAALMPRLSALFFRTAMPGVFGGILWIFAMRLMPQWDAGFTLAALLLFTLLMARAIRKGRMSVRTAAAAGFAGGIISLANPATLLVFAPLVLFLLIEQRRPMKEVARYVAIFTLMVVVCNVPWVIRNYRIWHALALRTNFGMTLYSSNNDGAAASLDDDGRYGDYERTHPVASAAEIALMERLGEVEFDRMRTAAAMEWIRSHPARFRELTLRRALQFWFPKPSSPVHTSYVIWLITALSIPGLILALRNRVPFAWFILFVSAVYPLMYYVVVSADRYRYPVLWLSLLPAGYFLTVCGARAFVVAELLLSVLGFPGMPPVMNSSRRFRRAVTEATRRRCYALPGERVRPSEYSSPPSVPAPDRGA
jgi:4-amino-4-deoxy-L-arabinose transferase-like glycosyltransferase